MKILIILLSFFVIIIGCDKNTKSNNEHKENVFVEHNETEETVSKKAYTLQEQIEKYDEKSVLLFQEEGNYTNSGYKELLAFCQSKNSLIYEGVKNDYVNRIYCFICDELNQTILRAIKLEHATSIILSGAYLDEMPLDVLGREIRWLGRRFGFIGDFNGNGKEELYFFESSSLGVEPRFYEFDENDFKEILIYEDALLLNLVDMDITNVDAESKTLTFENKIGVKPAIKIRFIWNNDSQLYEKIGN